MQMADNLKFRQRSKKYLGLSFMTKPKPGKEPTSEDISKALERFKEEGGKIDKLEYVGDISEVDLECPNVNAKRKNEN